MSKSSLMIAGVFILAGSLIYATCRQNVIFLAPLKGTKLLEWMEVNYYYQHGNPFSYFFLFCLPDVLWYAALLIVQKQFYYQSATGKILFYVAAALPFIWEFLKHFKVVAGTFDWADIISYLLTLLFFTILWKRKNLTF